ncbi:MAG: cation transporter [Bacteroidales bacterium]|nr:cation transporter [Bacteroidales bacterium]
MHQTTGHLSGKKEGRNLLITVVLNIVISTVELIGGLLSNSLALISDALHNFSDGIALLIAYITLKMSKKAPNKQLTFGYKRIQILAAMFNAVTLIAICVFLLVEAFHRLQNPSEVEGYSMLIVASIGMIANLVGVFLLKDFSKNNLNIKSAYLHLIGDTLSSVAVIVGGVLIIFFKIYWVDPVITLLISVYIIKETWHVLAETYHILMQSGPKDLQLEPIAERMKLIDGIKNIHHLHVWQLTEQEIFFEAHLEMENDMLLSMVQEKREEAEHVLMHEFGFTHITLQTEINCCPDLNLIASTS